MSSDQAGLWLTLAGRLHILLLHLPIGLLLGLAAVEGVALVRRRQAARDTTLLLVWLAALTGAAAAASGYILSGEGGVSGWSLTWHLRLGIALAAALLLTAIAASFGQKTRYRGFLLLSLALLGPVGHLGGSMTHGERFITEPIAALRKGSSPEGSAQLAVKPSPATRPIGETVSGSDVAFAAVQPILMERCAGCHGESRRRGEFAVHTFAALVKGGESGPALSPGQPHESPLLKRLRLPLEHDDHMPPQGKPQLTTEQIAAIERWIAAGAIEGSTIQPLAPAEPEEAPRAIVVSASGAPIEPLRAALVHAEPVAPGSDRLAVDFSAVAAQIDEKKACLLLMPVLESLVDVNLARCQVGDATMKLLAGASHLRRLDIRATQVSDAGIAALAGLPKLEQLSATNLKLTDAAAVHFAAMPALKRLYVWNAGLSPETLGALRRDRPALRVDAGDHPPAASQEAETTLSFTSDAPVPATQPSS